MNVPNVDMSDPLVRKIYDLKSDNQVAMLEGKYRDAIKARKELAKIGVDHFELVMRVPNMIEGIFSLFSKYDMRLFFASIIDKFRKKTPAEKKFLELAELYKKRLKNLNIRNY